jgi:Tol biopolymer transport system component
MATIRLRDPRIRVVLLLVVVQLQGMITPKPAAASHGGLWHVFSRVSVDSNGVEANDDSFTPASSADGRFVAFQSSASNVVAGDTNGTSDVFVHDRQTGQTSRVSIASDGAQANPHSRFPSGDPSISADGRFVAFHSGANNLVAGDNFFADVFVHDRQTGQTSQVSVASDGAQGDRDSLAPSISADGRFVAFHSEGANLVMDDTNGVADVFVHDRQTRQTSRVSVRPKRRRGR